MRQHRHVQPKLLVRLEINTVGKEINSCNDISGEVILILQHIALQQVKQEMARIMFLMIPNSFL